MLMRDHGGSRCHNGNMREMVAVRGNGSTVRNIGWRKRGNGDSVKDNASSNSGSMRCNGVSMGIIVLV